jgi:four helix bundle protein
MAKESGIKSYRDLEVWQMAMDLAVRCYKLSNPFPSEEKYGLSSQVRRASVSIAANIAEGWGRESTPSFVNHLRIAQGSTRELETHLILVERRGFAGGTEYSRALSDCERISKMLRSLIRSLNDRDGPTTT